MDDRLLFVAAFLLSLGGVVGIAYSLDVRQKRRGTLGPKLPLPGPIGRMLWWAARLIVAGMVLAITAAYLFKALELAWLALAGLALFFADHTAYRVVRLMGK